MKKWIIPLSMTTVLLSPLSQAYTPYGGSQSCGWWVEERRQDSMESFNAKIWIAGFLSGFGYSQVAELQDTDINAAAVFIDNWCQQNPLKKLSAASEALVIELVIK